MFIKPALYVSRHVWLVVIRRPLFSGKTEELIPCLQRAKNANLKVGIFRQVPDVRFNKKNIVSYDEIAIQSSTNDNSQDILITNLHAICEKCGNIAY
jgi:thymidine kinase